MDPGMDRGKLLHEKAHDGEEREAENLPVGGESERRITFILIALATEHFLHGVHLELAVAHILGLVDAPLHNGSLLGVGILNFEMVALVVGRGK